MIQVTIDDEGLLELLRGLYANKFHTASRWERARLNKLKRTFIQQTAALAKVEGQPFDGFATIVVEISLNRIDIDAPIKTILDSVSPLLFTGKDDRVIRSCHLVMRRPTKGTKKKEPVRRAVVVTAWPLEEYSASSGFANDVVCSYYDIPEGGGSLRTDSV